MNPRLFRARRHASPGWLGVALLGALLGACGRTSTPPGLAGCYGTELSARDGRSHVKNAGLWTICFDADGRYHAANGPGQDIVGRWRADADTVVLEDTDGPFSCQFHGVDATSARYRFRRTATTLELIVVRDECGARRDALTGRRFDAQ